MTHKTIKPINKDTTKPKSEVLKKVNKRQTKEKKEAFDFKKDIYIHVQREPLGSKGQDCQSTGSQTTDRALVIQDEQVLEHCKQVRENLLKCHSIEIISTYLETPNN